MLRCNTAAVVIRWDDREHELFRFSVSAPLQLLMWRELAMSFVL